MKKTEEYHQTLMLQLIKNFQYFKRALVFWNANRFYQIVTNILFSSFETLSKGIIAGWKCFH